MQSRCDTPHACFTVVVEDPWWMRWVIWDDVRRCWVRYVGQHPGEPIPLERWPVSSDPPTDF